MKKEIMTSRTTLTRAMSLCQPLPHVRVCFKKESKNNSDEDRL